MWYPARISKKSKNFPFIFYVWSLAGRRYPLLFVRFRLWNALYRPPSKSPRNGFRPIGPADTYYSHSGNLGRIYEGRKLRISAHIIPAVHLKCRDFGEGRDMYLPTPECTYWARYHFFLRKGAIFRASMILTNCWLDFKKLAIIYRPLFEKMRSIPPVGGYPYRPF